MMTRATPKRMRSKAARGMRKAGHIWQVCVLKGVQLGAVAGAGFVLLFLVGIVCFEGGSWPASFQDILTGLAAAAALTVFGAVVGASSGLVVGAGSGAVASSIAFGAEMLARSRVVATDARLARDAAALAPAVAPHGRGDEGAPSGG